MDLAGALDHARRECPDHRVADRRRRNSALDAAAAAVARFATHADRRHTESAMAQANPVRWFEIYVQDMERARRFYESVFQTKLERLNTGDLDYWSFPGGDQQGYGACGALIKFEGVPSGGNSTLVYFGCEDCAVEAGRVTQAGGSINREKMSIGEYGFIVLAVDTEGNMIGLHSMK
jgi:predicted enzyme related to lactoylglutathione lyase